MEKIFPNAASLVGNTPLVELSSFGGRYAPGVRLLAKLEGKNPAGSAKDRVALSVLDAAERSGELKAGALVVEPTSGNTGIALAAFGTLRGYRVVLVMPDNVSKERCAIIQAYGAEVVLTPAALGMAGAIARAKELAAKEPGSFLPSQFENPENPMAHYRTTGPEIFRDTDGGVDVFVAGIGTGGTVSGTAKYLKEQKESVFVVGAEPADSAVLTGGKAGPHALQGIGAGFVPKTLDVTLVDEVVPVAKEEAYQMARALAKEEGFLVGISSGAALAAACRVARRVKFFGKTVVVLLPDGGERYLSTDLFE